MRFYDGTSKEAFEFINQYTMNEIKEGEANGPSHTSVERREESLGRW